MGRKSSIKALPEDLREELDRLLREDQITLDQITAYLNERGAEVSRSAVGRYKLDFDQVRRNVRMLREVSRANRQDMDENSGQNTQVLAESLQSMLMIIQDRMMQSDKDFTTREIGEMSRAVKDLQGAVKSSADMEDQIRKRIEREVQEKAAKAINEGGRQMGLSREQMGLFNSLFLGVNNSG
ncbi:MAG: DUF3486 family protein [Magnetococcales bacterium]|nr:DUF3486 family protein [Magnetococcales bacterium]